MDQTALRLDDRFLRRLWKQFSNYERRRKTGYYGPSIQELAAPPTVEIFQQVLQTALQASFSTEEGRTLRFGISYIEPDFPTASSYVFTKPAPFNVERIRRLAPAFEGTDFRLGVVANKKGKLELWGATQDIAATVEVRTTGVAEMTITFVMENQVLLKGTQATFIDPEILTDRAEIWNRLLKYEDPKYNHNYVEGYRELVVKALKRLIRSMRSLRQGGILLIVPETVDPTPSLESPLLYAARAGFIGLERSIRQQYIDESSRMFSPRDKDEPLSVGIGRISHAIELRNRTYKAIGEVARLTAVDGAVVTNDLLRVKYFGAKIHALGEERPQGITIKRPVRGERVRQAPATEAGNTRHQASIQFAYDQPASTVITVSQDGHVSLFHRDNERVFAIRNAELAFL